MVESKRLIVLTDDNWRDYFSFYFPDSLVAGKRVPVGGFNRNIIEVDRLMEWVAEQNTYPNSRVTYTISRFDAALVLDLCAGRPPV